MLYQKHKASTDPEANLPLLKSTFEVKRQWRRKNSGLVCITACIKLHVCSQFAFWCSFDTLEVSWMSFSAASCIPVAKPSIRTNRPVKRARVLVVPFSANCNAVTKFLLRKPQFVKTITVLDWVWPVIESLESRVWILLDNWMYFCF